jgi:hypothetical protein
MQSDSIVSYIFPFFISIVTWVKMIQYKKNVSLIYEDYTYIISKLENLDININKNKNSIFDVSNQISYVDESLFNLKHHVNMKICELNNSITKDMNDIEDRINDLSKVVVNIHDNSQLKIINPRILFKDEPVLSHNTCQSPYNIIYTTTSKSDMSIISPSKKSEWVNITNEQNNCN